MTDSTPVSSIQPAHVLVCPDCKGPRARRANLCLQFERQHRRKGYTDLTEASFHPREDGRYVARCWTEDGKHRRVYRSRWRWEQAYGPIPQGMEVHHKNEISSDDSLTNLELKAKGIHQADHMNLGRSLRMVLARGHSPCGKTTWICKTCGDSFEGYCRKGGAPRSYCSRACTNRAKVIHGRFAKVKDR